MRRVRDLVTVERACIVGGGMFALGMAGNVAACGIWAASNFGNLDPAGLMRLTIPSLVLVCVGLQTTVTAFFMGLLDQPGRR